MKRNYRQYCGLARALDVVGDRWNLLIVRQLLIRPARYRDLLDGLPGVATNLLAERLRDLEAAGVLERRVAEEGGGIVYALTPWGAGLREPIEGLIRWSTPLMVRGPEGDSFRSEWFLVALPALFAGRSKRGRTITLKIVMADEEFQVRANRTGVHVARYDGRDVDAVVHADAPLVLGLAAGAVALADVGPLVGIEGDEAAVRAVFEAR